MMTSISFKDKTLAMSPQVVQPALPSKRVSALLKPINLLILPSIEVSAFLPIHG